MSHVLLQGFGYRNSRIHRIVKNFVVQGGDITKRNGTGGRSIYSGKPLADIFGNFKDEKFIPHSKEGLLSMANKGPHTNSSQFFITLKKCSNLDNKHVVFGEVVEGYEVAKGLELLDPAMTAVEIIACGMWPDHERATNSTSNNTNIVGTGNQHAVANSATNASNTIGVVAMSSAPIRADNESLLGTSGKMSIASTPTVSVQAALSATTVAGAPPIAMQRAPNNSSTTAAYTAGSGSLSFGSSFSAPAVSSAAATGGSSFGIGSTAPGGGFHFGSSLS
ncbi:hypothetical protein EON65_46250, partial [archaeon]